MKHFADLQLEVRHLDDMKHIETQLNRLSSQVAEIDMTRDEEARKEFFHLIMDFKEENLQHFDFETWKRVGLDLANLMKHHENQIAQGVVEHLREGLRNK